MVYIYGLKSNTLRILTSYHSESHNPLPDLATLASAQLVYIQFQWLSSFYCDSCSKLIRSSTYPLQVANYNSGFNNSLACCKTHLGSFASKQYSCSEMIPQIHQIILNAFNILSHHMVNLDA